MKRLSYKKAGSVLKLGLLLIALGLFSSPSYAFLCSAVYGDNVAEAVRSNNIRCARKLIRDGADINARDVVGNTSLIIEAIRKDKDKISFLIENNANPFIKQDGDTAKDWIYLHTTGWALREITALKLNQRYKLATKGKNTGLNEHDRSLLAQLETSIPNLLVQLEQEELNGLDFYNDPVVEKIYNMLVAHETSYETSALDCSEKYKNNIAEALRVNDIGCTRKLIRDGADINARDKYGRTALIIATQNNDHSRQMGFFGIVSLLIENNADPFFEHKGFTARDYAYNFSKEKILEDFLTQALTEEGHRTLQAELNKELANGRVGFYDSVQKEIYNMLVSHEASYTATTPSN